MDEAPGLLESQLVQAAYRNADWWRRTTVNHIERTERVDLNRLRTTISGCLLWLDTCLERPEICEPDLLSAFIQQFARLAGSGGQSRSDHSVVAALDQCINWTEGTGEQAASLYRARAIFFRTRVAESRERLSSLQSALSQAIPGSRDWIGTMVDLSEYYVEISRYRQAVRIFDDIRIDAIPDDVQDRYECATSLCRGVVLFSSFRNITQAETCLARACEMETNISGDDELAGWVARAYRYRGRIAELRGKPATALRLYLRGKAIQENLPMDAVVLGFFHLRIGELLAGHKLLSASRDHLAAGRRFFTAGANFGSGTLQADLGYAALYAAQQRYRDAEKIIQEALRASRRIGFRRGELLCLGYLILLQLRGGHLLRVPVSCAGAALTLWRGELSRNNIVGLLCNMPAMLSLAIRRMSDKWGHKRATERLAMCPCELHEHMEL
ncbi:hypothetical protein [Nonomuraea basaltis]|uniref:hypothetical protein n=1 Tax=Nonomuraea basaltis TaxID=2495887 RepID=UPI00110C6F86|nr:hypothetical protein [Nonomuraea basaltis]TMR90791.1 hypothetical protein EJK15_53495 [Nonomuraea basaltis]